MMMPVRHPFPAFAPENTQLLRENQYNYIRFDSLIPTFHYPRTHDSAKASLRAQYSRIPTFQLDEVPNLVLGLYFCAFCGKKNCI
jgi:hypothetical protein